MVPQRSIYLIIQDYRVPKGFLLDYTGYTKEAFILEYVPKDLFIFILNFTQRVPQNPKDVL